MKHFRNNPRKISKAQIDRLKKTMQKYGDLSGITHILETDELITGNQRSDAGDFINQKPIIEQQFNPPLKDGTVAIGYFDMDGVRFNYRAVQGWTTAEQQEANLIANAAGGDWDWKLLETFPVELLNSAGFDEDMLKGDKVNLKGLQNFVDSQEPAETVDAEPQIDRAAELLEKWQVKTGDLWQIGEHRLICGDCTDAAVVGRVMGGKKADMTFIDPPFNALKSWNKDEAHGETRLDPSKWFENDNMEWDEYWLFIEKLFKSLQGHSVYVCCDFRIYDGFKPRLIEAGYKIKHCIVWKKNIWGLGKRYRFQHEFIIYACKDDAPFYGDRSQSDVWELDIVKTTEHNTPKPPTLAEKAMSNSSENNSIIYDGCDGYGTTLVACQNLHRRGRAIEISPAYCAVTLERMTTVFPHLEIKRL